jgi:hypothetical protein
MDEAKQKTNLQEDIKELQVLLGKAKSPDLKQIIQQRINNLNNTIAKLNSNKIKRDAKRSNEPNLLTLRQRQKKNCRFEQPSHRHSLGHRRNAI